eukprot:TRINITY_DN1178_c0_g1_i1.p1 TRINITY_DN1178_c0_g1~~TRINITY_DN1178_c0_g1_i1.p1  ORF type:complete len:481 (+),score=122.77 TRINITY_DN1178_c0_g1_i1:195-1637(+)
MRRGTKLWRLCSGSKNCRTYSTSFVGKKKEFLNVSNKSDEEIKEMIAEGKILTHNLEEHLPSHLSRAISIRRSLLHQSASNSLQKSEKPQNLERRLSQLDYLNNLPFENYDWTGVKDACCENVIGYVPIPVGVAGPLLLNDKQYYIPMATTEGCLIASTHRGCKAISESGGAHAYVLEDGMTRGPVIRMPSVERAAKLKEWIGNTQNFYKVAGAFNQTSNYARLSTVKVNLAGRLVFMRFKSSTGDAMGMNMISKGVGAALQEIRSFFPDMEELSLSGNFCTDKKPSAINWLEGRGKTVVVETTIKASVLSSVLKMPSASTLVYLNTAKNLIGSSLAGSIGGNNAHASNIVTAIYIATGQDPAQNVESSNCMTLMEEKEGGDLYMTCTMPSIEVGTVGGGTHLKPQEAMLGIMGVAGANIQNPGENAATLGMLVAGSVLAGELSLMSALGAGHLVRSHMELNRKKHAAPTRETHTLPHNE